MQKFIKETTKKKLVIPNAVLELGGLEKGGTMVCVRSGRAGHSPSSPQSSQRPHTPARCPFSELSVLAMMGVCLGTLEERLMAEDIIYGL